MNEPSGGRGGGNFRSKLTPGVGRKQRKDRRGGIARSGWDPGCRYTIFPPYHLSPSAPRLSLAAETLRK